MSRLFRYRNGFRISKFLESKDNKDFVKHPDMTKWSYYQTRFKFGSSPVYEFEILAGHRTTGEIEIYDVYPVQKGESTANRAPTADAVRNSPSVDSAFENNLPQGESGVNKKFSFRADTSQDAEYMRAAENGDKETAQRLIDEAAESAMTNSKIRDEDGKLMPVYHGTASAFWTFDVKKWIDRTGRLPGLGAGADKICLPGHEAPRFRAKIQGRNGICSGSST